MAQGIYKRGKLYWIRYTDLNGIQVREPAHSDKYRDAETLLTKRKQSIFEGKQPEEIKRIGNHTFNQLKDEYLKWCERQRSFISKRGFITQLAQAFGNLALRRFTTLLVEHYQTERIGRGNKPATINRHIATLKHMFAKAVEWDMVEEEIQKRIRKVKLLEENNQRLRVLSSEECHSLINVCDEHLRPIVLTALNTGMRKGEILGLGWDQVDLKHGFICLDKTKNGKRREIPINGTLRETLQSVIRRLDVPHVFIDPKSGRPYQDVKRSFNTALRKAGIRDFKFHDLRHTFASQLIMSGADLTTVKELLGHQTLQMTLRYAHLAPSHKVKALDVLDSTLNLQLAQNKHNLNQKGLTIAG